ncbi:MAG: tRNA (adenosine(37)-N6)-dimethylallyltransferase MiaA [Qingshengfaniella sp.]
MSRFSPLSPDLPVLIAGPTASGKSALALAIAARDGRSVINADALQVYDGWQVLTARPGPEDLARTPHHLYGHVPLDRAYSVGDWLRDLAPLLRPAKGPAPVIVGGTGLYFSALTEGLADIPPTAPEIRQEAGALLAQKGLAALIAALDPETRARLDLKNPVRVQRAWEVQRQTGRGMAQWHRDTPPPILPLPPGQAFVLEAPKDWLSPRIDRRFDAMIDAGALDEAHRNMANWDPSRPSSQAIGARQLIAALRGEIPLATAMAEAKTATRQYAKRQRSWLRARMGHWTWFSPEILPDER